MLPIVWIHGFPLSSAVFAPQAPLGGSFPDLPGFGNAAPPSGELTMDDYARSILKSAPQRAIFAGLSMGGYIVFAIARLAPGRVGGLILIDTRETPDTEEARKGRFDTIAKVEREGVQAVADAMLPKMVKSEALKGRVREIMMSSSKEGVIAALRAMANRPDSSSLLPTLRVPTLIVVGEEDAITPPADAERMAKAIPGATLVCLPNAAHLSNFEQAEAFNTAVTTRFSA